MAEHTPPGPFLIGTVTDDKGIVPDEAFLHSENPGLFAITVKGMRAHEIGRLIAAAPDQHEALKNAPRPFVKIETDPDGLSAFVIAYADWFFKVRGAAITKATATPKGRDERTG